MLMSLYIFNSPFKEKAENLKRSTVYQTAPGTRTDHVVAGRRWHLSFKKWCRSTALAWIATTTWIISCATSAAQTSTSGTETANFTCARSSARTCMTTAKMPRMVERRSARCTPVGKHSVRHKLSLLWIITRTVLSLIQHILMLAPD